MTTLDKLHAAIERGDRTVTYRLRGGAAVTIDVGGTGPRRVQVCEAHGLGSVTVAAGRDELLDLGAVLTAVADLRPAPASGPPSRDAG